LVNLFERLFVWVGGALFVSSLAFGAYSYVVTWSSPVWAFYTLAPDNLLRDLGPNALRADAAANNVLLFGLFAVHHSLFARERVKRWLAARLPEHLLRSVYVWTASLLFILMCAAWQPIGGELYDATGAARLAHTGTQLAGIALIAWSVRRIDALELAGIRRSSGTLQTAGPYALVRHPVYLGWMLAVFGAAHMTGDRLMFAVATSLYLMIGVVFEERSLAREFPETYDAYRRRVRSRILPYVY
jgi:methanethiol S-methyltransferase